jgi:hypothetical protein
MPYLVYEYDEHGRLDYDLEAPPGTVTVSERIPAIEELIGACAPYIDAWKVVRTLLKRAVGSLARQSLPRVIEEVQKAQDEADPLKSHLERLKHLEQKTAAFDEVSRFQERRSEMELGRGWIGAWHIGSGSYGQVDIWVSPQTG